MQNVDLFIFGESYAGKFVPSFSNYILDNMMDIVNLRGMGVGDGFTDPKAIMNTLPSFSYSLGFMDW